MEFFTVVLHHCRHNNQVLFIAMTRYGNNFRPFHLILFNVSTKFWRAEESLTILSKFCKDEFVSIFVLKPFLVLVLGRGFSNQISALEMTTAGKVKRVIPLQI